MRRWQRYLVEGLGMIILLGLPLHPSGTAKGQGNEHWSTKEHRESLSLTIYNTNLGLVTERRTVELPEGRVKLRFTDVPRSIDATSVQVKSLTDRDALSLIEQQYRFDPLTPETLLKRYVGKEVILVGTRLEENTEAIQSQRATLLSYEQNQAVWKIGSEIVINPSYREIHFPTLPEGLTPQPTLVWLLRNSHAGRQTIEVSYLTEGLDWQAHYVLHIGPEGTQADLKGWVTITNQSGTAYEDADLSLIAGQPRRVSERPSPRYPRAVQAMAAKAPVEEQFAERRFFEYHLYRLHRRTNLPDQQPKQLSLISASDVRLTKEYVINGQRTYYLQRLRPGQPVREEVEVAVRFENTEDNHLGAALPAGIVRVYQADADDHERFVGEDRIPHTPDGEPIRVRVGTAFDIVAERKQTEYQKMADRLFESAFELTIRNRKQQDVTVLVNEPISGDWEIISANYPYEKTTAGSVQFTVPITAQREAVLVYRVRVRY